MSAVPKSGTGRGEEKREKEVGVKGLKNKRRRELPIPQKLSPKPPPPVVRSPGEQEEIEIPKAKKEEIKTLKKKERHQNEPPVGDLEKKHQTTGGKDQKGEVKGGDKGKETKAEYRRGIVQGTEVSAEPEVIVRKRGEGGETAKEDEPSLVRRGGTRPSSTKSMCNKEIKNSESE